MTTKLMFDTNVLARLCHPTEHRDVKAWFKALLEQGELAPEILVSVLADYELRRALLDVNASEALRRLDDLARVLRYVPITAEAAKRAIELRRAVSSEGGRPHLSDADLLMAAQAEIEQAILVTSDVALLRVPGITAREWHQLASA